MITTEVEKTERDKKNREWQRLRVKKTESDKDREWQKRESDTVESDKDRKL